MSTELMRKYICVSKLYCSDEKEDIGQSIFSVLGESNLTSWLTFQHDYYSLFSQAISNVDRMMEIGSGVADEQRGSDRNAFLYPEAINPEGDQIVIVWSSPSAGISSEEGEQCERLATYIFDVISFVQGAFAKMISDSAWARGGRHPQSVASLTLAIGFAVGDVCKITTRQGSSTVSHYAGPGLSRANLLNRQMASSGGVAIDKQLTTMRPMGDIVNYWRNGSYLHPQNIRLQTRQDGLNELTAWICNDIHLPIASLAAKQIVSYDFPLAHVLPSLTEGLDPQKITINALDELLGAVWRPGVSPGAAAVRVALETYTAWGASGSENHEALQTIAAPHAQMRENGNLTRNEFRSLGRQFHLAIARAAGVGGVGEGILTELFNSTEDVKESKADVDGRPTLAYRAVVLRDHQEILDAIGRHDRSKAQWAMRRHLTNRLEEMLSSSLTTPESPVYSLINE